MRMCWPSFTDGLAWASGWREEYRLAADCCGEDRVCGALKAYANPHEARPTNYTHVTLTKRY